MCGIYGLVSKSLSQLKSDQALKYIKDLALLSESRGKEAAGLCIEYGGALNNLKAPLSASKLLKSSEYKSFISNIFSRQPKDNDSFVCIGHSRLVTNGYKEVQQNNQPVITEDLVGIHNGIICNAENLLKSNSNVSISSELDSEVLFKLIEESIGKSNDVIQSLQTVFEIIEGTASIAMLHKRLNKLILATNNGSIFYAESKNKDLVIFASEKLFLEDLFKKSYAVENFSSSEIIHLKSNNMMYIDIQKLDIGNENIHNNTHIKIETNGSVKNILEYKPFKGLDIQVPKFNHFKKSTHHNAVIEESLEKIGQLRRCTKCVLPESHPFISFDEQGVCNFCRDYVPQVLLGDGALMEIADKQRNKSGEPDCMIGLSGGRDSCFALHYAKEVLKMNPIAYTYDWGLVTDLARRNQARMCGKLGVELIIMSADIDQKRKYVRENVLAWLKKPDLGIMPLFIAGDKMFFSNANKLRIQTGIDTMLFGINELENTDFKEGYCGIHRIKTEQKFYDLRWWQKLQMLAYYGKAFLTNPSYFNSSLIDTTYAFFVYYLIPHHYIPLFNYHLWNEKEIESTLIDGYNWEVAEDTKSTWRIGDGTASFYNYIYYTVGGFTECDSFRSNQIREGTLSRDKALEIVNEENKIRYDSIDWYCHSIGIDVNRTLEIIDNIPRRY